MHLAENNLTANGDISTLGECTDSVIRVQDDDELGDV
jgi:hypothetical protein